MSAINSPYSKVVLPYSTVEFQMPSKSLPQAKALFSSLGQVFQNNPSLENRIDAHPLATDKLKSFSRNAFIKVTLACIALAAALGLIKYARSFYPFEEILDIANAPADYNLTVALAITTAQVGRRLLSTTAASLFPNLILTEETPYTTEYSNWDFYRNTDGSRTIFSAQQTNGQPLPSGLRIFNDQMHLLSTNPIGLECCVQLASKDNYAFAGNSFSLKIFDVADPLNIQAIPFINTYRVMSLKILDNLCYIVRWESSSMWLTIMDISKPFYPVVLSSNLIGGITTQVLLLKDSKIVKDLIFLVGQQEPDQKNWVLKIINFADLTSPMAVGTLTSTSSQYVSSLTLNKNASYCFLGDRTSLSLIDVSIPSNPTIRGSINLSVLALAASNDNNIFFAGTDQEIQIIDASNPSKMKNYAFPVSGGAHFMETDGHFLFVGSGGYNSYSILKYDTTNPQSPLLVSQLVAPADSFVTTPNYLLLAVLTSEGSTNLLISTLGDAFGLIGSPEGGTQGSYSIDLTATSLNGSVTETFQLEINPAIVLDAPIPPQKAIVGAPFIYFPPAFSHVHGLALTYTANLINSTLPAWLQLNSLSGTFSGTPGLKDRGILEIQFKAHDTQGASASTTFQLTVSKGPGLNIPIPNQVTTIDNPYNYTLSPNTFIDREGYPLAYSALQNGDPLPNWLNFDPTTQTFSGVPSLTDGGLLQITVIAQDPTGTTATAAFSLNILAELPPTLLNPISNQVATVGKEFRFSIPDNTFTDTFAKEITYRVKSSDGSSFPNWLSYDPQSRIFSGTPGYGDTDTLHDRVLQITLTAQGIAATQSTQFNINVTGVSTLALALKILGPLASAASAVYTAYKLKYLFWNTCRKSEYQKPRSTAIVGRSYQYAFSTPKKEIAIVQALHEGVNFSAGKLLPGWLYFDGKSNSLRSDAIENENYLKKICIRAIDHQGYIREEFKLHLKEKEEASLLSENKRDEEVELSARASQGRLKENRGYVDLEAKELLLSERLDD
jgi:hypothetical protein